MYYVCKLDTGGTQDVKTLLALLKYDSIYIDKA